MLLDRRWTEISGRNVFLRPSSFFPPLLEQCVCVCVGWSVSWALCILRFMPLPQGQPGLAYNCPLLQIVTSLPPVPLLLFFPLFILLWFQPPLGHHSSTGPPWALGTELGGPCFYPFHNLRPFLMALHYEWVKMQKGRKMPCDWGWVGCCTLVIIVSR